MSHRLKCIHRRKAAGFCSLLLICLLPFQLEAQVQDSLHRISDTIIVPDSTPISIDTLLSTRDSLAPDTLLLPVPKRKESLSAKVEYRAQDSIRFNMDEKRVYLYTASQLDYEKIELKADFVRINFDDKLLYASGLPDTTGKLQGNPEFSEDGETFRSKEMYYNFDSKKGLIYEVITQEGDGYLHGSIIKKLPNDEINIKYGKYTTCNHEHPHFEFRFTKSKVIPNNKIVTGPAYLVIEDVPTPLIIPFGLFPNSKGQRNGILLPTYGESANRGFFFENFGYYLGINDYLDLELRGDIYTRGSWAIKTRSSYKKRYKYDGSLGLRYAINITGDPGSVDYSKSRDYAINWRHQQSAQARPNSRFQANVNVVSNKFNQFNPTSANDYLSNTFQSSVSYQTSFSNRYFLTASLNHRQNVITGDFDMTLPELSFNVNRFFPFRRKEQTGKPKWYENISVQYKMNAKNQLQTLDSLLFTPGMWEELNSGVSHNVPVSSTIKVLKYLNLTNSINYNERWYFRKISQDWINDTLFQNGDTTVGYLQRDTTRGFYPVRDFSFNSSLSTRVYGMLRFRKGPVTAIRHVMNPSLSFSYTPDFSTTSWGYYDRYINQSGQEIQYSYFAGGMYGLPPSSRSGRISFSLGNNLEMKVRNRKDTLSGTRKVVLIENLSFATAYDLAKDSLNWSNLSVSGRTTLFKNLILSYASSFDPYIIDSTGRRKDQFEWDVNRRLFRFSNASWNLSLSYRLSGDKANKKKSAEEGTEAELEMINQNPQDYVDFNIPWNLSFSYSLRYLTRSEIITELRTNEVTQSFDFNGDVNITPKWKVGFRSGYDFISKEISYTSVDIYRDLHCWEMRFNWIPKGQRKSWNFTINVKSSMLQDLKLNRKKDFRDY